MVDEINRLNRTFFFTKSVFKNVFGKEFSMKKHSNRLMLQKSICILKNANIAFDYEFSWYIRGPYSSRLANDGFSIVEENVEGNYSPLDLENEILSNTMSFMKTYVSDEDMLELVASLIFLLSGKNCSKEDTQRLIKERKPWFKEEQIDMALDNISNSGLFN